MALTDHRINGVSSNGVLMEVSADLFTVAQELKAILQKTKDSTPLSKKPSFDASSIFFGGVFRRRGARYYVH